MAAPEERRFIEMAQTEERQSCGTIRPAPVLAGNQATGTLKIIALVFMMVDHMGKMLFPAIPEMRVLGRIAFPLYCWCLVVGACYTRSMPKYMLRLLIVGLISQPLYKLALNHTWLEPNIFLTLLIALMGLWGIREKKYGSEWWAPPLTLILAELLNTNYGWKGIIIVYLLYAVREQKGGVAAVMTAFCLFWGSNTSNVTSLFGLSLKPLLGLRGVGTVLTPFLRLQGLALLALPFMLIPMKNIRMPAWLSYAIYPLHLLVLYGLEQII